MSKGYEDDGNFSCESNFVLIITYDILEAIHTKFHWVPYYDIVYLGI